MARRGDPPTSFFAGEKIFPRLQTYKRMVLAYLVSIWPQSTTQLMISRHFDCEKKSTFRARVPELEDDGWAERCGEVHQEGERRELWRATLLAVAMVQRGDD